MDLCKYPRSLSTPEMCFDHHRVRTALHYTHSPIGFEYAMHFLLAVSNGIRQYLAFKSKAMKYFLPSTSSIGGRCLVSVDVLAFVNR